MDSTQKRPRTIDEAANMTIEALSPDERARIAALTENQMIGLHFSLGLWVRNNLDLWSKECLLTRDMRYDADHISMEIVGAVRRRLHTH